MKIIGLEIKINSGRDSNANFVQSGAKHALYSGVTRVTLLQLFLVKWIVKTWVATEATPKT